MGRTPSRVVWRAIARAQESKGYGKQVVERLAADLQAEFPGMAGFSPQNLWFMRGYSLAWSGRKANSLAVVRDSPAEAPS